MSRILVVADPADAAQMAVWLREAGVGEVLVGDGGDDTLSEFERAPADVVVLAAGLAAGDALSFAGALRDSGHEPPLILIAEENGPVRTALDAGDFGAERFLRRPLAQAALIWAVRSCISPRAGTERESPDTLAARIELATVAALADVAAALRDRGLTIPPAAPPVEEAPLPLREPTQIISAPVAPLAPAAPRAVTPPPPPSVTPPPQAPEEARTGTFVNELRKHMSLVEARLFGDGGTPTPPPVDYDDAGDIDLDAFGVSTLPGLPAEALDGVAAPNTEAQSEEATPVARRGDLQGEDMAALLARLFRERFTGRVDFKEGDTHKSVYFEEGRAVFAVSSLPHDRMGDLLVREGEITRAQNERAHELAADAGRRLGEVLVELGYLKRRELLPAVRRHVEEVVYSLFAWEEGAHIATPNAGGRDERIRLAIHPYALILEGIRRKMRLGRLRRLVGGPATIIAPVDREELATALADAELTPEERAAAESFDGLRRLEQIAGDEATVYPLAHALLALGLVRRLEPGREPREREPTEPGRVSAPQSSITGAADLAIDRERVLTKHAHVREADYFTVLGVRRDATTFEIRRAWEAARRDYATDGFAAELARELATELEDIHLVLDEAQRVLRDERVRAAYSAHLEDLS